MSKNAKQRQIQTTKIAPKSRVDSSSKQVQITILVFILLVTIYVFGAVKGHGFVWDDFEYIVSNPYITTLSFQGLGKIFSSFYSANYHPLTTLSWALEYHFAGLNAAVYHITNIVFHLVNCVLVFYFVKVLTTNIKVATFVAVLFAIHPMHVESVAWISARKDLLYTLFYLLSLLFYVKYIEKKKFSFLIYTFLFFALSCFSKSAAITLPLILVLLDYYKENLSFKSVLQKLPFLALSVLFGIIAILSQKTVNAINEDVLKFDLFHRIIIMIYSVYYYFSSFFIPRNLCALHYYPSSTMSLPIEFYVAPFVLLALFLSIFLIKKYRKELIFGLVFYLISISLIIQLIPLGKSMVSERYTYVPYIGIAIMLAQIIFDVISTGKNEKRNMAIAYICFGVCVLIFSMQSNRRNKAWQSGETLFTDVINQNPHECFGYIFRCYHRIQENNFQGSIDDCDAGLAIDSNSTLLYSNRGVAKLYLLNYKGALADFNEVIKRDSLNAESYLKRGQAKSGVHDFKGAIFDFETALKRNPLLITVYLDLSLAKLAINDVQGAIDDLNKAIVANPTFADAFYNRGNCYYQLQKYNDAIGDYSKAIELDPKNDKAICNRGIAKTLTGDMQGACVDFKKSTEMGNPIASQNYAKCK